MSVKESVKEFDPDHVADIGYARVDWNLVDSPELSENSSATALPLSEALPEPAARLKAEIKRRTRPSI